MIDLAVLDLFIQLLTASLAAEALGGHTLILQLKQEDPL